MSTPTIEPTTTIYPTNIYDDDSPIMTEFWSSTVLEHFLEYLL